MARWEPNAQGRMMAAALDLFEERGFEHTTAGDIAAKAGVTERTFFRHFADKREVLFDGAHTMEHAVHDVTVAAPADSSPLDAALAGVAAAGEFLADRHAWSMRRARVVAANPSLQERELLKLAAMTDATVKALHERGVADPMASLAAHSAITVFHVAFARWVAEAEPPSFADCVAEATTALRALQ